MSSTVNNNYNNSEPVSATAVIIGRGGSKGLPGKNRLLIAGKPIIQYSIEHARQSKLVNRIIVSSDCSTILETAEKFSCETIHRPADLANDTATVDAAVRHAVENDNAACVVILYANVPIRPDNLIDKALNCLITTSADSVQSYQSVGKYHPYWESYIDDKDGRVTLYFQNKIYRRQDLPPLYIPDGGVIAVTRRSLFDITENEPHSFLGKDRRGIINESGSVVDIDCRLDLIVAEAVITDKLTASVK